MPNLTEEQWERVKLAIDQLDNLTTAVTVMTTVPDSVHVSSLRETLPAVRTELMAMVEEVDG